MSTSPYSLDLREKVINYIKNGNSQKSATEVFNLHRNTVNRWIMRYKKEGHYNERQRPGFKSKINKSEVESFVQNNPDVKLTEVGKKFGVSSGHAGRILKQLGFTYKKNLFLCGSKGIKTV